MFRDMPFRYSGDGDHRKLRIQVLGALKGLLREGKEENRFLELSPSASSKAFVDHTLAQLSGSAKALIDEAGMCVLLPHHPSSDVDLEKLLAAFKGTIQELHETQVDLQPMPACVTISRSVDDTITGAFDNSREKGCAMAQSNLPLKGTKMDSLLHCKQT